MTSSGQARIVYVVGSGRSGTSTIAGALKKLGLHVPQPEIEADDTNPKGFAEPAWAIDFHQQLLNNANVTVSDGRPGAWESTDEFGERPRPNERLREWLAGQLDDSPAPELVIKDPRLTWFLPMWSRMSAEFGATPTVLTMLRPPAEVVGSKQKSYDASMDPAAALAGWLNLQLGTELRTRGMPRVFIKYHDLLADWRPSLDRTAAALGLDAVRSADDAARSAVDEFIDPSLHRAGIGLDDLDVPSGLRDLAADTWDVLAELATPDPAPSALDRLDTLRAAYAQAYDEAARMTLWSQQAARRQGVRRERRRLESERSGT